MPSSEIVAPMLLTVAATGLLAMYLRKELVRLESEMASVRGRATMGITMQELQTILAQLPHAVQTPPTSPVAKQSTEGSE